MGRVTNAAARRGGYGVLGSERAGRAGALHNRGEPGELAVAGGDWQTDGRKLEASEGSFPVLRITPITTTGKDCPGPTGCPTSAPQVPSFKHRPWGPA